MGLTSWLNSLVTSPTWPCSATLACGLHESGKRPPRDAHDVDVGDGVNLPMPFLRHLSRIALTIAHMGMLKVMTRHDKRIHVHLNAY